MCELWGLDGDTVATKQSVECDYRIVVMLCMWYNVDNTLRMVYNVVVEQQLCTKCDIV